MAKTKAKTVRAWALMNGNHTRYMEAFEGMPELFSTRRRARDYCPIGPFTEIVRVEIRPIPPKKRKVKK